MRELLENERIKRGWSVDDAAKRFNVSPGAWRKWVYNQRTPSLPKMNEISKEFKKPIDKLFLCQ